MHVGRASRIVRVSWEAVLAILLVSLFLPLAPAALAQTNLVQNPGFESATSMEDWSIPAGFNGGALSTTFANSGSNSWSTNANSAARRRQDFVGSVTAGSAYQVTMYVYQSTGAAGAPLFTALNSMAWNLSTDTNSCVNAELVENSWDLCSFYFEATASGGLRIDLSAGSSTNTTWFDDVYFAQYNPATATPTNTAVPTNTATPTPTSVPSCELYEVPPQPALLSVPLIAFEGEDPLLWPQHPNIEILLADGTYAGSYAPIGSAISRLSDWHDGAWGVGDDITFRLTTGVAIGEGLKVCDDESAVDPPPTATPVPTPDSCEIYAPGQPSNIYIHAPGDDPWLMSYDGLIKVFHGSWHDIPASGAYLSSFGTFTGGTAVSFYAQTAGDLLKVCSGPDLPTPTAVAGGSCDDSISNIGDSGAVLTYTAASDETVEFWQNEDSNDIEYRPGSSGDWSLVTGVHRFIYPGETYQFREAVSDPLFAGSVCAIFYYGGTGPDPTVTPYPTRTPTPTLNPNVPSPTVEPSPTAPIAGDQDPCNGSLVTVTANASDPRLVPDAAAAWQRVRVALNNSGVPADWLVTYPSDLMRPINFVPTAENQIWKSWHKTGRAVDVPQNGPGHRVVTVGSYQELYIAGVNVTQVFRLHGWSVIPSSNARPEWWHFEFRSGYTWHKAMTHVYSRQALEATFPDENWSDATACGTPPAPPSPTVTGTPPTATPTFTPSPTRTATPTGTPPTATPTEFVCPPEPDPFADAGCIWPVPTELPTWTALPTYTPLPTWTAGPTWTPFPTSELPTGTPEIGIPEISTIGPVSPTAATFNCRSFEPCNMMVVTVDGLTQAIGDLGQNPYEEHISTNPQIARIDSVGACSMPLSEANAPGPYEVRGSDVKEGFCGFVEMSATPRSWMRLGSIITFSLFLFWYVLRTLRRLDWG